MNRRSPAKGPRRPLQNRRKTSAKTHRRSPREGASGDSRKAEGDELSGIRALAPECS